MDQQSMKNDMPTFDQLQAELKKDDYKRKYNSLLRNTVFTLIIVAAIAVLVAMLLLPVLQISGSSMADELQDGDIVLSVSHTSCETGDIIAFYYNNHILVKRVIAAPGQWVDIDEDGYVYVDGVKIYEPYVKDRAIGDCNITLPYQVPSGRYFVMGDNRATSIDSRNTVVGCVSDEMIIGKIIARIWPFNRIGAIG